MSEWSWVLLGFSTTYGSIVVYFAVLHYRRAGLRRQLERLR